LASGGRREAYLVAQRADLVDAAVAGGVQLDEIQGAALQEEAAGITGVAGLAFAGLGAVHCLGQQAAGGGLAGAAGAGEQVGVGDLAGADGVGQGAGDGLLAGHLGEGLGAPLAVEDFRGHGS
jgi:hypothetical protein